LDRRLAGTQSRSGRGDEEKNSQPLPELEPPTTKITYNSLYARYDVYTTVKIQFAVFLVVAPCSVVVRYHHLQP
jgi:hypothetical protein